MEKNNHILSRRFAFFWQTILGSSYLHIFTATAVIVAGFTLMNHLYDDGAKAGLVALIMFVSIELLGFALTYIIERRRAKKRAILAENDRVIRNAEKIRGTGTWRGPGLPWNPKYNLGRLYITETITA